MKLGTYDEPPRTSVAAIAVGFTDGSTREYDCVGTKVESEKTTLLAFDWVVIDEDAVREMAAAEPRVSAEEIEREIEGGSNDPMLILSDTYPWRMIEQISLGGEAMEIMTPVRELSGENQ